MRILHIDETFHPKYGYQCNPLAKFQQKQGNEVSIIAPDGRHLHPVFRSFGENGNDITIEDKEYENTTGVKVYRVKGIGYIMKRLVYSGKQLYKTIDAIKPDVIMIHQIETLTAMRVMKKYKDKYPMVLDSHMLSLASKNKLARVYERIYKNTYTKLIIDKGYTVILTQDDDYVTTHLGIPKEQTKFISFGTDTMLFSPDDSAKITFLKERNLPLDSFVIVSTGKLNEQKNGQLLADTLKKSFARRKVVALIVANFVGGYVENVKRTLEESENTIVFFPVQNYTDLPFFYQVADVTVFPKQCSMSFYDAQACGSPVISEKGHINEERNSHGNGLNFECGSVDDFRAKIQQMIDMPEDDYRRMRENSVKFVSENYGYDIIANQYTEELEKAYDSFIQKQMEHGIDEAG